MTRSRILLMAAALALLPARAAQAQWLLSPTVGTASGGLMTDGAKVTYGGQLGFLSEGPVGFEADYGYTAKVRGGHGHDNFRTFTVNVLVAPAGWGSQKWRPYAAVGGGLIGAVGKIQHIFAFSSDEAQQAGLVSAGGGLFGFVSNRFGVRLDVRYLRALLPPAEEAGGPTTPPHIVRVGGGLVIRF